MIGGPEEDRKPRGRDSAPRRLVGHHLASTFLVGLGLVMGLTMGLMLGGARLAAEPDPQDPDPFAPIEAAEDAGEPEMTVPYGTTFDGDASDALLDLLRKASHLVRFEDRPPATPASLERRAESDIERLQAVLRSEGFYAAEVTTDLDESASPAVVTVSVTTGTLYLLSDYQVLYEGNPAPEPDPASDLAGLGLDLGMPARAPDIEKAQSELTKDLKNTGYPLVKITDRKAIVDHAAATMVVTLTVDPGPRAGFGPISVTGLTDVEEDHVRRLITWEDGAVYDDRQVEDTRQALSRSGLFASIRIRPGDQVDGDGRIPMTVALGEREHRSIGAGASFSTSEGPGAEAFWEHRNILGRNERLRLSLAAALINQRADASFRKPHIYRLDQSLLVDGSFIASDTDAFEEKTGRLFVGIERKIDDVWQATAGTSLEFSDIDEDLEGRRRFLLYGLPLSVRRDTSDNLLNPTEGTRLTMTVTPYLSTLDETSVFVTSELAGSGYLSVDAEDRVILAARGRLGSLVGPETRDLPPTKRFYSGGGGSIRGFEFQTVGPLNPTDEDPLGGRSVIEVGAEARIRFLDDFGVVPFVEGGTVSDEPIPNFEERFLWAVGLGLRYFTGFGPLRLDVAFPVNPRESDDFFQFYVSLGQAF